MMMNPVMKRNSWKHQNQTIKKVSCNIKISLRINLSSLLELELRELNKMAEELRKKEEEEKGALYSRENPILIFNQK